MVVVTHFAVLSRGIENIQCVDVSMQRCYHRRFGWLLMQVVNGTWL